MNGYKIIKLTKKHNYSTIKKTIKVVKMLDKKDDGLQFVSTRVPPELWKKAKIEAVRRGIDLQDMVAVALQEMLEKGLREQEGE